MSAVTFYLFTEFKTRIFFVKGKGEEGWVGGGEGGGGGGGGGGGEEVFCFPPQIELHVNRVYSP